MTIDQVDSPISKPTAIVIASKAKQSHQQSVRNDD